MRETFRKIISLFFLLLAIAPLGITVFIVVKEYSIHRQMEKKMESHELQTIRLPEAEVKWMDRNEIWVNNLMFDVHSKKWENGIYIFTGMYDEEETRLVEKEKEAEEESGEQHVLLVKLYESLAVFCDPAAQHACISSLIISAMPGQITIPVSQYKEILTPPPQFCC